MHAGGGNSAGGHTSSNRTGTKIYLKEAPMPMMIYCEFQNSSCNNVCYTEVNIKERGRAAADEATVTTQKKNFLKKPLFMVNFSCKFENCNFNRVRERA